MLQQGKLLELAGPSLALAVCGHLAQHPTEAGRFNSHQYWSLTHEDLVEGPYNYLGPGELVQDFQQRTGPLSGFLGCSAERSYRGRAVLACKMANNRWATGKLTPSACAMAAN